MRTPRLALVKAINTLGGPVKAARRLEVPGGRYQTIQSWIRTRVPAEYCPAIERETSAEGRPTNCEELRPDVAWGVLRSAPPPSQAEAAGSDPSAAGEAGAAAAAPLAGEG